MTSQIRGLNMAYRNTNDAVSMLQTADGALASMTENVQRIRELALQAANSTLSRQDREAAQSEVNNLIEEISRVLTQSTFNGNRLFVEANANLETDSDKIALVDGLRDRWLQNSEERIKQFYGLEGDGASLKIILDETPGPALAFVSGTVDGATGKLVNQELHIDIADFVPVTSKDGGTAPIYDDRVIAHEMVHAVMGRDTTMSVLPTWFLEGTAEFIHGADERVDIDLANAGGGSAGANALVNEINGAWTGSSAQYSSAYTAVRYLHQEIKSAGGAGIRDVMEHLSNNTGATLDDALAAVSTNAQFSTTAAFLTDFTTADGDGSAYLQSLDSSGLLTNADTGAVGGADADGGRILTATSVISDVSRYSDDPLSGFAEVWEDGYDIEFIEAAGEGLSFQVGAQAGQTLDVSRIAMDIQALGLDGLDVVNAASKVIDRADSALEYMLTARSEYGASLSRLESMLRNNQVAVENTSAARSRIQDADFAAETANLVRANIQQQAGLAMVAQANTLPNLALQLLN